MADSSNSNKTALVRPTVFTPETQAKIITSLAEGNYLKVACDAAGITDSCFRHWRLRVESGDPNAQHLVDFFAAIKKASAEAEQNAIREVRRGEPGWQGNAWFLERRFHQRWGRKDKVIVEKKLSDGDLSSMSDEELEAIKRGKGSR